MRPPLPWSFHSPVVHQPPSGFITFPTELRPHGASCQPLSSVPSISSTLCLLPCTPCQPPTPDSSSNPSSLCLHWDSTAGETHTTLHISATANLRFLISAEFSTLFLNLSWVSSHSHSPQGLFWTLVLPPLILMTLAHILREIRLSFVVLLLSDQKWWWFSGQVAHRAKMEWRVRGTTYCRINTFPGDHNHAWLRATAWNASIRLHFPLLHLLFTP